MRHRVKKIKLGRGYDYNKATMRKLANNFIIHGKLTTTKTKAKYLKPVIEKIVEKAKEKKESNINYLRSQLNDKEVITMLFDQIGPKLNKEKNIGGYVRLINLSQRSSDGAMMAQIVWSRPVVLSSSAITSDNKEEKKLVEKSKK